MAREAGRRSSAMRAGVTLAVGFALLTAWACQKPFAEVETELGQTTTKSLKLPGGASLTFPVRASWVNYDDAQSIYLTVELLSNGRVVGTMSCLGFTISRTRTRGCGSAGTNSFDECRMVVPSSGADAIRVSTRLDKGWATVKGLTILVQKK